MLPIESQSQDAHMKRHISAFLFVLFVTTLLTAKDKPKPVKDDIQLTQGKWVITSVFYGGKTLSEIEAAVTKYAIINGNKITFHFHTEDKSIKIQSELKLDSLKSPKQFEIKLTNEEVKDIPSHGIYERNDTNLKFCYRPQWAKRPTSFTDHRDGDDKTMMFVLKKSK